MSDVPHDRIDRDLSRIIRDPEDGWMLLRLLTAKEWEFDITPTWGGDIVLTGRRRGEKFSMAGPSVAHIAVDFFKAAAAIAYAQEHAA